MTLLSLLVGKVTITGDVHIGSRRTVHASGHGFIITKHYTNRLGCLIDRHDTKVRGNEATVLVVVSLAYIIDLQLDVVAILDIHRKHKRRIAISIRFNLGDGTTLGIPHLAACNLHLIVDESWHLQERAQRQRGHLCVTVLINTSPSSRFNARYKIRGTKLRSNNLQELYDVACAECLVKVVSKLLTVPFISIISFFGVGSLISISRLNLLLLGVIRTFRFILQIEITFGIHRLGIERGLVGVGMTIAIACDGYRTTTATTLPSSCPTSTQTLASGECLV